MNLFLNSFQYFDTFSDNSLRSILVVSKLSIHIIDFITSRSYKKNIIIADQPSTSQHSTNQRA